MAMQSGARQTGQAGHIGQQGDGIVFSSLQSLLHLQGQVRTLVLAKRHIRARHAGLHRSVHKGRGMDFAESRMYQPGDDIRTIDWRVTARSGRVHTKVLDVYKRQALRCERAACTPLSAASPLACQS